MPERHLDQPPAERRQHVQPLGRPSGRRRSISSVAARRGRRVVDGEAADVPVRARGLHPQELRVEARQLAHVMLSAQSAAAAERQAVASVAPTTSSALAMSSAPTSRCVTARTVRASSAPMITPLAASCGAQRACVGDAEDDDVGGDRRRVDARRPGSRARPAASVRALSWSSPAARRGGRAPTARRRRRCPPGAARRPSSACSATPRRSARASPPARRPSARRGPSRSRSTRCRSPRSTRWSGMPEATTAFISRAPSMCSRSPLALRDLDDLAELRERPHVPAGEVRGLLDRHEPRARAVAVARRAHARPPAWRRRTSRARPPAGTARRRRSPPGRRPRP